LRFGAKLCYDTLKTQSLINPISWQKAAFYLVLC